ncbi:DUF3718 domain-containing protein [Agaribacter flavus]|uniref:DUF3718 domain-containing protein n=1 Tax=Agaribacter flavus TaxID=1902781 RepID=A0ABV7FSF3_9ALTE
MRKLVKVSMLMLGSFLIVQNAAAISKSEENRLVKVCEAIQSNSRLQLSKTLKNTRLSHQAIMKGLVCNGDDPISFALKNGAVKNAKYLAHRSGQDMTDSQLVLLAKVTQEQAKRKG